jgi:hypothetical protein
MQNAACGMVLRGRTIGAIRWDISNIYRGKRSRQPSDGHPDHGSRMVLDLIDVPSTHSGAAAAVVNIAGGALNYF